MSAWVAVFGALAAFITGIFAVGNRYGEWAFDCRALGQGRLDAMLYVGVIVSTIWSIAHCLLIAEYAASDRIAQVGLLRHNAWQVVHLTVSLLLIGLHAYVRVSLGDPRIVSRLRKRTIFGAVLNEP